MKKDLPGQTHVRLLFSSGAHNGDSVFNPPLGSSGEPQGRVFIGLATHQTTGTGFHIHGQLIPTVER